MSYISGISRVSEPKNPKETASYIRKIRTYDMRRSYARKKQEKRTKMHEEKIKYFDERYSFIVKAFMNEISKRNISVDSPELDKKIDEILSSICEGKYYQTRFAEDNIKDIKNAILRKVNLEKQKFNEER